MKRTLKRRRFLQQVAISAGALGAALPIASSAFSKDPAAAPSNKITIGCIGVGGMGTGNMKVFLGLPDCRVVAVCDAYQERREKAKQSVDMQYGDKGCTTYADYRDLLARKDIDALMIAPQDHWHALIATAAAKAGKDMYCEKPLGVSVEESQAIRRTIRTTQRVFQTGTWQRSLGKFQHACRLVRNGYIGKIHTLEVASPGPQYRPKYHGPMDPQPVPPGFDWTMWRGPAADKPYNPGRVAWPDWYLIWDYCAGFIANWGVHHLDIANWGCPEIGSEPFSVECKAVYRKEGFTDNVDSWDATFRYAGGLKMIFTDTPRQKPGCKFIGDNGWVYVDRSGIWAQPESLLKVKIKPEEQQLTDSKHHGDDFLQCIRSRKDPVSSVDASHKATCLGMIADIAARLQQKLSWDPQQERFVGSDEANKMLRRPMHNGWSL
jgi:predicted dehydrogenase